MKSEQFRRFSIPTLDQADPGVDNDESNWETNMTHSATTPTAERRSAPRRQPTVNTICRLENSDGGQSIALVWNISTTGVSILVPEPRPAGSTLNGYLDTLEGEHLHPITMEVVHCKKLDTGDYALGTRFLHTISEDELSPFLADI